MVTEYYVISDPFIYSPCGDGNKQKMTGKPLLVIRSNSSSASFRHILSVFLCVIFYWDKDIEPARIPA